MPYRIKFRRRRENKTNYSKRKIFIISGKIRFCVRRSNKYILVQFIKPAIQGDITLLAVNSMKLKKYGWPFSCKNLPAAYLTGYLAGLKALKHGIKEAVLDIGLRTPTKGNRIFAVVKGAIDAGLEIPVGEEVLPSEERIKGSHIVEYFKILKEKGEHEKRFSAYVKNNLNIEEIQNYFEKVKSEIFEKIGAKNVSS